MILENQSDLDRTDTNRTHLKGGDDTCSCINGYNSQNSSSAARKEAISHLNEIFVRIAIDQKKCTSCGMCMEVCPFGLPQKAELGSFFISDPDSCVECSACQRNCLVNAIIMQEREGCGCLWDAMQRSKQKKGQSCCEGSSNNQSCC